MSGDDLRRNRLLELTKRVTLREPRACVLHECPAWRKTCPGRARARRGFRRTWVVIGRGILCAFLRRWDKRCSSAWLAFSRGLAFRGTANCTGRRGNVIHTTRGFGRRSIKPESLVAAFTCRTDSGSVVLIPPGGNGRSGRAARKWVSNVFPLPAYDCYGNGSG